MGDRANVAIVQHDQGLTAPTRIYLYTHWAGYNLPATVQKSLKRGEDRWDDEQYLSAIIIRDMIGTPDMLERTTGLGIMAWLGDGYHRVIVVDCENKTVHFESQGKLVRNAVSFKDYCALESPSWDEPQNPVSA